MSADTRAGEGARDGVSPVRWVLGGLGLLVGVYGAWLLLSRQDLAGILDVGLWLVVGVLLHDVVLSALLLLLGLLTVRLLPPLVRGPVAAGVVVLGTVTMMAVPVLGRFGATPLNPTLLDRDYVAGWFALAGLVALLVALVVVLGVLVRRRRDTRRPPA